MFALQLYIIRQRVSLFCAKFRICSFIVLKLRIGKFLNKNVIEGRERVVIKEKIKRKKEKNKQSLEEKYIEKN